MNKFKTTLGRVLDREIKVNKDSKKSVIVAKTEMTAGEDVQSIEIMNHTGEDNNPPNDSRLITTQIDEAYKICVASDDNITPITEPGEKRIYATDEGNTRVQVSAHFKNDGELYINNDNCRIIMFPSGEIHIENDNGYIHLQALGNVIINGAQIPVNGDVITAQGVSLNRHRHNYYDCCDGGGSNRLTEPPSIWP